MTLSLTPITFEQACVMVRAWHRHHRPPTGHKFSIGLAENEDLPPTLVGAIIVGRPVARHYDDGHTLEVLRSVVADDIPNGNSMLYGAAWRAAKALGYRRLITYTQAGETGSSLRGAGWRVVAERPARKGWDTPTRRRLPRGVDGIQRTLWEAS